MRNKAMIATIVLGVAAIVVQALFLGRGPGAQPAEAAQPPEAVAERIVAPGRVEPISEEIDVGAEIPGKLASVPVEEGDRVRRGQVIATLENADYRAAVASARATVAQREAELRRVVNGARGQERHEAEAAVREAEAILRQNESEMARRRTLFDDGVIAREEFERAEREFRVARERTEAARQRALLVNDDAREEDRSAAVAAVEYARAQLAEAEARLAKTAIHAPLDGVIVRKHLHAGEMVSDQMNTVIVTVADTSVLRVRADIDEVDVARIRVGQPATMTAAAYGDQKFTGHIVRVGQILGRKNVRTDEPTERVDTKILETLIELDAGQELPLGLRVDVFVERTPHPGE